jgi:hypothetical protein
MRNSRNDVTAGGTNGKLKPWSSFVRSKCGATTLLLCDCDQHVLWRIVCSRVGIRELERMTSGQRMLAAGGFG